MTTEATPPRIRPVIEGRDLTPYASVRTALDFLHGPPADLEALAVELAAGLEGGAEDVLVDRPGRLLFSTDASLYEMEPVAVVYPRSAADVRHAILVAGRRGIPVLPRGAGTSLAGQSVNHAVVLDLSRHMDRVLEVNVEERWVRVQPGM